MPVPEVNFPWWTSQSYLRINSLMLKGLWSTLIHKWLRGLFRLLIVIICVYPKILEINTDLRLRWVHFPRQMIGLRSEMMIFNPDIPVVDIESMTIFLLHGKILIAVALPFVDMFAQCNINYSLPQSSATFSSFHPYVRLILIAELRLGYLGYFLSFAQYLVL